MEHVFRNTVAGAAFVLGMGFLAGCSENYTSFEECKDKEMAKAGESRSKQTAAWSYCKQKFNYKSPYELEKEAAYAKLREKNGWRAATRCVGATREPFRRRSPVRRFPMS